ncbi:MAG: response regulator, partial [Bacteroidia bacterium]
MGDKINILYVDDEVNNLISFKATFRLKFKIFTAESGKEAIKILDENDIHIIITDQRMPEM